MPTEKTRPSPAGYWIAALVALLGVMAGAGIAWFSFSGLAEDVSSLRRVPVPGERVLSLGKGKHVVYLESRTPSPPAPGTAVEVTVKAPGGAVLPLSPYATSFTYSAGGRAGRAVHTFQASEAGGHRVTSVGPAQSGLGVAIGPPAGETLVSTLAGAFGGIGLLIMGPVAGGVIALITFLRRLRSARPVPIRAGGASPPAGWYPDPGGSGQRRWWNGTSWTEQLRE